MATGPAGERYLRTLALRPHGHRWPFAAHRWAREIRAAQPDLIEVGDAGPEAWAALWAARSLDVPLIAFCHSDIVQMAQRRLGPVAGAAARIYSREFYRRCDLVHRAKRVHAAAARGSGASSAPSCGRLASISTRFRRNAARRRCGASSACRRAHAVARLCGPILAREKSAGDARRVSAARVRITTSYWRDRARQSDLPRNVTLLPFLHSSLELARILASADGFVHAGDQETFGLVLIEAMACGRGVVAANAGAMPEIVTPDTGVLVAPGDARAMADGVRAFYDSDPERLGPPSAVARRRRIQLVGDDARTTRALSRHAGFGCGAHDRAMRHPESRDPCVAIALHDVSPATWRECAALLEMLDGVGAAPLSLLVVPRLPLSRRPCSPIARSATRWTRGSSEATSSCSMACTTSTRSHRRARYAATSSAGC